MSPTSKDLDSSTANSQALSGSGSDAGKPQPVALEVPVTVNGARTVEGSDKREPFSESTQTVLVFGNGAVIRLASSVAAGQLLFLTNDKTKKEVVCQVVKSKNYRSVSGYVELEFTEAVSGFWGMRFPGERPAGQPSAAAPIASAPKSPTAPPKVQTPPASSLPKPPQAQPVPAPPSTRPTDTTSALKIESKPLNLPSIADLKISGTQPNSFSGSFTTSSRAPEVKPPAPITPQVAPPTTNKAPSAPVSGHSIAEEQKLESERLRQQISSMFTPEAPAKPPSVTPPASKVSSADAVSKVIEMGKQQPPAPRVAPPQAKAGSSLDAEEVKIPSWLEPLARNAATPAHNEIPAQDDDVIEFEVQDVSAPATQHENVSSVLEPSEEAIDMALPAQGVRVEGGARKDKKGLVLAIAAGVLLAAAGGTWYVRQSSAPSQQSASAATIPAATAGTPVSQPSGKNSTQPASNGAPAFPSTAEATQPASSKPVVEPQAPQAQPLRNNTLERSAAAELSAYRRLAEPAPKPPEPKKPTLGEVHLAAPSAARRSTDSAIAEPAPALGGGSVAPSGDALGGGLSAGSSAQPAAPPAPLAVGGDVKTARLLNSVPPIYPPIARTQRVQGDVRIDALIDATGKVQEMKVVSGPPLLHQAAMDAVHQWKYQAATLDGKAVPMHLTVTVQFRLQ